MIRIIKYLVTHLIRETNDVLNEIANPYVLNKIKKYLFSKIITIRSKLFYKNLISIIKSFDLDEENNSLLRRV